MAAEFVFEDEEIRSFFKNLHANLKGIRNGQNKFVGLMSSVVFRDVMEHFENEEGESGPWQAWSKVYQKHMNKIGRSGNKKLQFTGRLRNSFQPGKVRKKADGLEWFNNAKTKGTSFPYAQAHDEGGPQLPQREFMWLSEKGAERLSQQMLNFLLEEKA